MDGLDRLYYRLVQSLRSRDPDGSDRPFTVADVYQQLVPFRAVRHELGFGELAEYERALLRLLAGERDYVHLDARGAQEELRRELDGAHPILGLYRDYASAALRLNPDLLPAVPADEISQPVESLPLLADDSELDPLPWLDQPEGVAETRCWECHTRLPADVEVRFCPFCGVVQESLPCVRCEALVRAEWRFCVRCGLARQPQSP